jgi:uncharacterized membrane protein
MHWILIVGALLWPGVLAAQEGVLERKGCVACHSLDGSARQGPTFAGLSGRGRRVLVGGAPREVIADRSYLRRAIEEPDAEVVEGYPAGMMPRLRLSPEEIEQAIAQIEGKASVAPLPPPDPRGLLPLLLSAVAFVGLHLGLSSEALRPRLLGALGEKAFQGAYSVLVGLALAGMVYGFEHGPYIELWSWGWARWLPIGGMPLVMLLWVIGFSTPNPTSAGQSGVIQNGPRGIVRITRHPALWGFVLWGALHIPANGDLRSLILFSSFIALALAGMVHIDRRRARALGEAWGPFAEATSVLPFGAILRGKNRLVLPEIGWVRPLIALLLYVAVLHGHRRLVGVPALP